MENASARTMYYALFFLRFFTSRRPVPSELFVVGGVVCLEINHSRHTDTHATGVWRLRNRHTVRCVDRLKAEYFQVAGRVVVEANWRPLKGPHTWLRACRVPQED